MAEGAHITSAFSHERPSFFEVLAQESLISTIRPALKHAIRVAAESRPERFGWLLRHFDEVYVGLHLLLEQQHLHKYCATFSEHFYNLQRHCPGSQSEQLPTPIFLKSLLFVVLIPYVKQKLDDYFENQRHLLNTYATNKNVPPLTKAFVAIYPYLHTTWEGAILAYQTAYLFKKSNHHSPFLHMSGARLINDLDTEPIEGQLLQPWDQLSGSEKVIHVIKKTSSVAAGCVTSGLSVGVFFVQFLDWWYSGETNHAPITALPVPDPPNKEDEDEDTFHFSVCPVCHRTRSNDTALSVSGYVFCYPCIYDYVREYKMCPVTKYPAQTDHLIKLYISET
ncbi:peroxisome assembly protein 12-like [Mya arenaria]|uniref:peroxisome assembly protein 12-like n=1 Tax=Mya arenaria TaxID=6604 RepID=UPI0022DEB1B6|nr:peroxisome assembly protein 12-like [Mya arenaria]